MDQYVSRWSNGEYIGRPEVLVKAINVKRRKAKGGWYWHAEPGVRVKGYGTWLQVYEVNGVRYAGLVGRSVAQFKRDLMEPFQGGA